MSLKLVLLLFLLTTVQAQTGYLTLWASDCSIVQAAIQLGQYYTINNYYLKIGPSYQAYLTLSSNQYFMIALVQWLPNKHFFSTPMQSLTKSCF